MINLLYNCNKSFSSSVKNNNARHTHIPKMKNQNKSYFALNTNALIQTCCNNTAKNNKTMAVIINHNMNCITNFDSVFFNNNFQVILSVFSLFFMALIRHFKLLKMYRSRIIMNNKSINSFHIRNNVQNVPSRPSWNVTKVCKKNCNRSQIMNILHNNITQNLKGFEQILDHRDVSFFIFIEKKT